MSAISPTPPPPPQLRAPGGLAKAVTVCLGLVIAVDLCSIVAGLNLYRLWGKVTTDGYGSTGYEALEQPDRWYRLTDSLHMMALLLCAVVFITWFWRVRANAAVFSTDAHSKTRPWVIFGWFVPVVSLWFPRRIALDTWAASEPDPHLRLAPKTSNGVVNSWWALWLTTVTFGRLSAGLYNKAAEVEDVRQALLGLVVSDLIDIGAVLLAMRFVHKLTALQYDKVTGPATAVAG